MKDKKENIVKSTKGGKLYIETSDFFKQLKIKETVNDLLKSDIVKDIEGRKKINKKIYYTVLNFDKTVGYTTTNKQMAYEVRKGAISNCYDNGGFPDKLAIEFCRLYSENEDCTIIENEIEI